MSTTMIGLLVLGAGVWLAWQVLKAYLWRPPECTYCGYEMEVEREPRGAVGLRAGSAHALAVFCCPGCLRRTSMRG